MIYVLIGIAIYIGSFAAMYLWVHKMFNKGGEWEVLDVSIIWLMWTAFPVCNTVAALLFWSIALFKISPSDNLLNKFFNVKK